MTYILLGGTVLCKVLELLKRFASSNIDGLLQGTLLGTVF